ncbi:hypothetical protein D0T53_10215 [Dysgonomonas sp. 216]|uniref:hypothetical protein n=1 Tax=Dysgonomonas sp. 216 TaxID=2302934 RepID=UPI0013D745C3|nr:hypothetical protein [Dysgonomonas sp. 216]NDW19286.1 hypothetical protein [Dysgonomonas sp. 216]
MARIQTPINGITTTSTYSDGDCYSLVNLRSKNGALHPVAPRKIVQELSQKYSIVFVHQNNDYKNWIGVVNNEETSSVYWDIRSDKPKLIQENIQDKIHSIQQTGNTISLVTEDNVFYLFYHNSEYRFLGEIPELPPIMIGSMPVTSRGQTHWFRFDDEYGSGTITKDSFIDATKGLVNIGMNKLVNGWTGSSGIEHKGYGWMFFDACLIRYAFRLFDGTLVKHSAPILFMPTNYIIRAKNIIYKFSGGRLTGDSEIFVGGYRATLNYNFAFPDWEKWKDIITSVDMFVSAPLGVSNIENIRKDMPTNDTVSTLAFNLIKEISSDAFRSIEESSTFYYAKSFDLGVANVDLSNPDIFPSKDKELTKMDNLIYQEVMSDDNLSNHKYGSKVSYAYNNRLHIADIKTTFFNGFDPRQFQWYNTKDSRSGDYNGYKYIDAPFQKWKRLIIEVEIATGYSTERVYKSYTEDDSTGFYKLFMSAFISYPDPRAKRLIIYMLAEDDNYYQVAKFNLTAHKFMNLAYFINDGLKPIISDNVSVQVTEPDISKVATIQEPNKIKVSELSNPLRFPNANTYLVSNGTVLAMATNTMNVSDRNYGQFPLYVFTSQGIWNLNVGSNEVVYSSISAPTHPEAPTTSVVCSTPFGVVFTSQRGLQIINGQSVEFISPQLESDYLHINMELPDAQCKDVIYLFNDKSFKEYLKGIENIIYNPYESEIIISDRDSPYNYVLNLASKSFYKSTEQIDITVENVFPKLLVIGNNILKDYEVSNNKYVHISIVLRPLIFGSLDIKNLERIILRALLVDIQNITENKKSVIMAHHSNDGVNFPALRGLTTNPCNRSDYDMGLFASSKFRQFIFSFAGMVDESSRINFLDTQIKQEYDNSKMR